MSDFKNPEDSLSSYFDELLDDQEQQDSLAQVSTSQLAAGASRVVALPQKTSPGGRAEAKKLNLVPAPQVLLDAPKVQAAEPEYLQTDEQKQKLERMLQTARTQLLIEAKPREEQQVKVETVVQTRVTNKFENRPDEIQDWVIDPEPSEALVLEPHALETAVPILEQHQLLEDQEQVPGFQLEGLNWLENGRPQWAQNRFDVLLFDVAGLTLAVPLIALGQIQPLTDELTPLFGQADWFMGLQPTPAGKIRTVNTAKFVMPERYDENFVNTAKYVVSIDGVPWGLAVDSVNQPISLHPDDVKWRGDRSKRPWLAGTVKEHMCALLDIPRIGQMLVEADRNFRPH